MKAIFGLILVLAGLALGAFVALYVCLYGGIVQIVEAFQVQPISAKDLAIGMIRILLTPVSFWLTMVIPVAGGVTMIKTA